MDELTLLRRLDADTPAPTRAVLTDAFDVLTERMTATEQRGRAHVPPSRRRRTLRLRRAALITAGAAALVVALVLTDTIGVAGVRPGATAEAAELLDRAAEATIRSVDPVVRPGQFLQVETRSVHQIDGNGYLYAIHEDRTTWIPADVHGTWTEARYPDRFAGQAWGAGAAAAGARDFPAETDEAPQVLHGEAGNLFGGEPAEQPEAVEALPRDPRVLLNHIYRVTFGAGQSPDQEALVFIADTLNSGFARADLRASLYRAAALIPDVTLVAGATNLDGVQGVAIGRVEPSTGIRRDLIIDPRTGLLIGDREVLTRRLAPMPAGATNYSSSVTTTVVDAVPARYRPE